MDMQAAIVEFNTLYKLLRDCDRPVEALGKRMISDLIDVKMWLGHCAEEALKKINRAKIVDTNSDKRIGFLELPRTCDSKGADSVQSLQGWVLTQKEVHQIRNTVFLLMYVQVPDKKAERLIHEKAKEIAEMFRH